ncbi:hypothetical protein TNCV_4153901 [Trichonephila clavipes]|nr:hypothetical protein TNCV_4153901 [Trichonephila clavipes]
MLTYGSIVIITVGPLYNEVAKSRTRGHGSTPLRVKEDIEDASSELEDGAYTDLTRISPITRRVFNDTRPEPVTRLNKCWTQTGWVAWLVCRWPSAPKVAGSTPAEVGGFSRCKKSTGAMLYDYTVCERSLECLFGLDALGKIKSWYKFTSSDLRCLPLGRKLPAAIGIRPYGAALKSDTNF